jgi:hypothetical protein
MIGPRDAADDVSAPTCAANFRRQRRAVNGAFGEKIGAVARPACLSLISPMKLEGPVLQRTSIKGRSPISRLGKSYWPDNLYQVSLMITHVPNGAARWT